MLRILAGLLLLRILALRVLLLRVLALLLRVLLLRILALRVLTLLLRVLPLLPSLELVVGFRFAAATSNQNAAGEDSTQCDKKKGT